MTAISSTFNPLATGDGELLVFYNDNQGNLTLLTVEPDNTGSNVVSAAGRKSTFRKGTVDSEYGQRRLGLGLAEPVGPIRNPSSLATFMYKNLVSVYGVTDADSQLTRLSPAFNGLGVFTETIFGSLAGCSDGSSSAWLYYLRQNPLTIKEYNVASKAAGGVSVPFLLTGTSLSACWDPTVSKRVFVYQSTDSQKLVICTRGAHDSTGIFEMETTTDSLQYTPIASCCQVSNHISTYYIYYLKNAVGAADNNIVRLTFSQGQFQNSVELTDAPPADTYTNLSVTPGAGANHLFYMTVSGDANVQRTLYYYVDNLDS